MAVFGQSLEIQAVRIPPFFGKELSDFVALVAL